MHSIHTVLLSSPYPRHLSRAQSDFLRRLEGVIQQRQLRLFDIDKLGRLDEHTTAVRQLHGVLVVAFAQWKARRTEEEGDEAILPTEFAQLHIATAIATDRPLLVLKEKAVSDRGALRPALGARIVKLPSSLDPGWLNTPDFLKPFDRWTQDVEDHCDVFLGYCSKSQATAAQIQLHLEKSGATVLNWALDFRLGTSILNEIEAARSRCSSGVFLFTEDDPLEGPEGGAAPRDNVVFEAGYFVSSKGAERCLIVREGTAKMPADLGGAIYVQLRKGDPVETIASRLADFVAFSR